MQENFKTFYSEQYCPGCWNCLDKVWQNDFCPGFMCVRRKPHPFGIEYHTICYGDLNDAGTGISIMWHAEIEEGKDRPPELGAKKYDENGKTFGLMCPMVKPIKSTGKCVTMDNGFAVSMGLLEMEHVMGVYGQ